MDLTAKVLVTAALAATFFAPTTWLQSSPQGAAFKLGFPVAMAPTANGVWSWSGDTVTSPGVLTIGVVPNPPGRLTTITDISVWTWSQASYAHALWWIRDGVTGQILISGALSPCHGPNGSAGKDSAHLSTPIVLGQGGAASPTLEFGAVLGTPTTSVFQCSCSVVGRHTDIQ